MYNQHKVIVIIYLLAFSATTNAGETNAHRNDDWTIGDVLKYGAMAAVGGVGAVMAAPVVLATAGFTGVGIAAGSVAAVAQAGIGNIVGGSVFAALQSAGVAGLGGFASTVLATGGAAIGAMVAKVSDKKDDKKD
ncbi:interferon alpha-inducible protein 27-like protein 2A [Bradysia coprophila]|uniref:interferon alpha-inducible protein 27-like protein 2A n=1 Tax=Bradysia coprophila TaxID=38358 RepID=UPI00187DC289|nr:interferon alpha-inducible protein 27-like protein 2A [Bradysia coprophila]